MAETEPIGGPFLNVATFCENVLQEKDDVHTLVRLVDRYNYEIAGGVPPGVEVALDTHFVVAFKSGDFVGSAHVRIRIRRPSGDYLKTNLPDEIPVTFQGGEHGSTLRVTLTLAIPEDGLYWAEVELDRRLVTRVPLRVERRSTPGLSPASAEHAGS